MSNRELSLAILAGATAITGAIVWYGLSARSASRESTAPSTGASLAPTGSTQPTPPALPAPSSAIRPKVEFGSDTFDAAFTGAVAQRAESECWAKAKPGSPGALRFRVALDATGKVVKAEPEYAGERDESTHGPLYKCVSGVIRTMTINGITRPTELVVQATRPNQK